MAPPLSSDSLTSLHALQDAARKHSRQVPEISLPERPRNFQNDSPYSDAAIGVVSVYTTHLYSEHGSWATEVNGMRQDIKAVDNKVGTVDGKIEKVDQKVDRFEHGAKEALIELSDRLDDVEEDLKELRKEVKDVQSQVKDVQSQVKD
ncbi:hypothetical protein BJX76DRAFT_363260, partial [Aspergillus varians]